MNLPFESGGDAINTYKKMLDKTTGLTKVKEILNTLFFESNSEDVLTKAVQRLQSIVQAPSEGKEALEATFLLGFCYHLPVGVKRDDNQAIELFTCAAEQGHAFAQFYLAVHYHEGYGIDILNPLAVKFFTLAADKGLAMAQTNLGLCYLEGEGVDRDEKQALELFQRAANQGDWGGQLNLGVCYYSGTGVPQDGKRAIELYTLAAHQRSTSGQNNLALAYYDGTIIAQDQKRAVELYTLAAEDGCSTALCNLGSCYWEGTGVRQNLERAVLLYQAAARKRNESAKKSLEEIYASDQQYPSLEVAADYYNSIKGENLSALTTLAFCYQLGLGVPQKLGTAIELYLEAMKKNIPSHWDLYMCYRFLHQRGQTEHGKTEPLIEFYETLSSDCRRGSVKSNLFFAYLHEYGAPGLPKHSLYTAERCYDAFYNAGYIPKSKEDGDLKQVLENSEIEFDIDIDPTDTGNYVYGKIDAFGELIAHETILSDFFPSRGVVCIIAEYAFEPEVISKENLTPTLKSNRRGQEGSLTH